MVGVARVSNTLVLLFLSSSRPIHQFRHNSSFAVMYADRSSQNRSGEGDLQAGVEFGVLWVEVISERHVPSKLGTAKSTSMSMQKQLPCIPSTCRCACAARSVLAHTLKPCATKHRSFSAGLRGHPQPGRQL